MCDNFECGCLSCKVTILPNCYLYVNYNEMYNCSTIGKVN